MIDWLTDWLNLWMYEWIFLNTRKCVCGLSKIERRKKILTPMMMVVVVVVNAFVSQSKSCRFNEKQQQRYNHISHIGNHKSFTFDLMWMTDSKCEWKKKWFNDASVCLSLSSVKCQSKKKTIKKKFSFGKLIFFLLKWKWKPNNRSFFWCWRTHYSTDR